MSGAGARSGSAPPGPVGGAGRLLYLWPMQTTVPARLRDAAVFGLIDQEKARQTHGLELIASENYVSDQVMAAQGSVLTNKYAEGLPGKRY